MCQRQVKAGQVRQGEEEEEGETHRGQVSKRRTLVARGESGEERRCDEERGVKKANKDNKKLIEYQALLRGECS